MIYLHVFMKRQMFSLFFLFLTLSIFSQSKELKEIGFEKIVLKTKSDTIFFIKSINDEKIKKPTIIFLQGSLPLPIIFKDKDDIFTLFPFKTDEYLTKYNLILIARKGIPLIGDFEKDAQGYKNAQGEVPFEYIKHDNHTYRTQQAREVLNFIYTEEWVDKKNIYVVGHSEGYEIAASLAEKNTKIKKVVCLSADPFNRAVEEVAKYRLESYVSLNDSIRQKQIYAITQNFLNIENIDNYKNDYDLYNWASYDEKLTFESFKKIKVPVLVVYGTDDFKSFHSHLLPFLLKEKKDFFVKAYPDYDHNFFKKQFDNEGNPLEDSYNWDEVFRDCVHWLETGSVK
ncbi:MULTISPECIES: acyl-CoA thioester hydrolase/BAAT C-terminal domain-containing protein [Flavobacterium]|uniref:Acyl-CoA thioester hydrolase/BAAT C-terminal domain-containing protein n=1 Tax=Flavobacterium jumunjinense TaxID=998845 RepID=A0ABV5GMS8_9FLAO|nr:MULTISPECIES: acyl-CoA thioester hydrolase/BAAT C-terminal domain-containing protein [Flavobacterium]